MTKDETSIKTWIQNNRGCHYWLRIPIEWYDYFKGGDFNWIAGLYKTWYDNHVWLYNFRYTISEGGKKDEKLHVRYVFNTYNLPLVHPGVREI